MQGAQHTSAGFLQLLLAALLTKLRAMTYRESEGFLRRC
jgi:hypothetical protein